MDLNSAISKHAEWKVKFRGAIAKKESLDAATIAKDNCCDLGKYLHGEAKAKFAGSQGYRTCVEKHASFHVEAGKVAAAINAKRFDEATAMIGAGTPFSSASNAVGVAIMNLQRESAVTA